MCHDAGHVGIAFEFAPSQYAAVALSIPMTVPSSIMAWYEWKTVLQHIAALLGLACRAHAARSDCDTMRIQQRQLAQV
jgi:hypothetical protein